MAADPGQLSWKCYDCNMTFGNPTLLQKHKARFCVGGQLGDPDLLLLRKGLRDEDPPLPRAPPDDSDVTPRYNPNQDPKVQQLAENHGRQMEYLQSKNRELERQREEIRRRLEELGRRPAEKDNSTEELLRELREQEARNQRLLEELRKQLAEARRPVQVIQQPTDRQPDKKAFIYPVYYGNSLVAEIIAVRQAYLQNGGNDPDILAQLAQMQAEAQAIDDSLKNAQKRQPKEKGSNSLTSLELENERLQRQLLLLQEQKLISTNRRKDNREDELEREIHRLQKEHLRKMYELQREMERMRQETMIDRMRLEMQVQQQPTKIILQQAPAAQPQRAFIDLEATAPYDQYYSPRRVQAYGHTWVHTQHRQDAEPDPYFDLQL